MRDWLIVIIVLLIAGIVLDGIRRMRIARRTNIKMSKTVTENDEVFDIGDESLQSSEFPSGGARVAGYRDEEQIGSLNDNLRQNYEASLQTAGSSFRQDLNEEEGFEDRFQEAQSGVDFDLGMNEPVSMYAEETPNSTSETADVSDPSFYASEVDPLEPSLGSLEGLDVEDDYELGSTETAELHSSAGHSEPSTNVDSRKSQSSSFAKDWLGVATRSVSDSSGLSAADSTASESRPSSVTQTQKSAPSRKSVSAQSSSSKSTQEEQEVIVINIMAPEGMVFDGEGLLETIVGSGLRFGQMDIFHRHSSNDGRGEVLFSLANMVVPGTFNLSEMSSFESPGVSLFMTLPLKDADSLSAFRLLTDTATSIAEHLGGELKDENRSVMTRQTIEHCRQRIMDFERRRRVHHVPEL